MDGANFGDASGEGSDQVQVRLVAIGEVGTSAAHPVASSVGDKEILKKLAKLKKYEEAEEKKRLRDKVYQKK